MFDLDLRYVVITEYLPVYAAEVSHAKIDEQQQQSLPDNSATDPTTTSGLGKNPMNEDDLKATYAVDSPVRFFISLPFPSDFFLTNVC